MARLLEKLVKGQFTVTVEIDPPRGARPEKTLEKVRRFGSRVDAVNIADCPMANVRMSPITVAHFVQRDTGVESIFHLTCRDRNIIGLQAELLGAAGLGVRNILALRGDEPARGDHPGAKGVFEADTPGLIKLAAMLNAGQTAVGGSLDGGTDFAIGCAVNPNADDLEAEISRLEQKVLAGAHFVQTQPVFSYEKFERWLDAIRGRVSIPILYGVLPLKDYKFGLHLNKNVPGMEVPVHVLERMKAGGRGEGVKIAAELVRKMAPDINGVHIFPMNSANRVVSLLDALEDAGVRRGVITCG